MAASGGAGNWLLVEELLERADPAFVDELRAFHDAKTLADFAPRWYADRRPPSRKFLLEYLERPLNAFRHEGLIKRLFKLAEAAGDDPVMARFLVLFDRSIRHVLRRRRRSKNESARDDRQAQALAQLWRGQGFETVNVWRAWNGQYTVWGTWSEEAIVLPQGTTMPRGRDSKYRNPRTGHPIGDMSLRRMQGWDEFLAGAPLPAQARERLGRLRLFSVRTRQYLRRRAWRYFRRLGKQHFERYLPAVLETLRLYEDADVVDGLALLDNWGLLHILFHHSPALQSSPVGWRPAEGHSLAELAPAPFHARLWKAKPRALVDVLRGARCRPVRQWALQMIRSDPAARASLSLDELLALLGHEDSEVVAFAAELMRSAEGLDRIEPERWLSLAETTNPAALEIITELMEHHLAPNRLTLPQLVRLTASRPLPLARLGLTWLNTRTPRDESECAILLGLVEAQAEPLRPEIVRWARGVLSVAPGFKPEWVLEYLDSRHADVRAEGLSWLQDEPRVREDVAIWQRLMESPYDDIRFAMVAELEARVSGRGLERPAPLELDPDGLRLLWASVLLNIHRGNRTKPVVVRQLLRRVERRPQDLPAMLPLLSVALRSVRRPEWRAGLAAVVQLAERRPDAAPAVRAAFPELQWT